MTTTTTTNPKTTAGRRSAILARLREPSTWAALGVLSTVVAAPIPPDLFAAAPSLVALVCAGLGVALDERGGR